MGILSDYRTGKTLSKLMTLKQIKIIKDDCASYFRGAVLSTVMLSSIAIAMLLVSCSNETKPRLPAVELTPDQIGKYQTSCAACHENEAMGAPLKGEKEAWANVFAKPFEEVMYRVINGYRGMPPLGQCFDCGEQDLRALVYYLAQEPRNSENIKEEQ